MTSKERISLCVYYVCQSKKKERYNGLQKQQDFFYRVQNNTNVSALISLACMTPVLPKFGKPISSIFHEPAIGFDIICLW